MPLEQRQKIKHLDPMYIFKANGCKKCNGKGYKGRLGVFEVLKMTNELSNIIANNPSEQDIAKQAKIQGMTTMEQDGIIKVLEGKTSLEEIVRISDEK